MFLIFILLLSCILLIFSNVDVDPMDTLKLAETESKLWAETQILNDKKRTTHIEATILPSIPGR